MKIWNAFASEHSMNLVMIGRFKDVRNAEEATVLIERLTNQVSAESQVTERGAEPQGQRFSAAMLDLLRESNLYSVGASELEQFEYDVRVERKDNEVVVTTDEVEVSAFLKVLLEKGGRVEIYSAHNYPDTGLGR